jgi:hypothetical protein
MKKLILSTIALVFFSANASASLIIDFSDVGSNTLITVSGTFNSASLTTLRPSSGVPWATGGNGTGSGTFSQVSVGSSSDGILGVITTGVNFELFSSTVFLQTINNTGPVIGFWNITNGGNGQWKLGDDYVSGTNLFSMGTLVGFNIVDLGINNTGLWRTLQNRDEINITVNGNVVPEPSIIALFGLGLLGLGFARRKKA